MEIILTSKWDNDQITIVVLQKLVPSLTIVNL